MSNIEYAEPEPADIYSHGYEYPAGTIVYSCEHVENILRKDSNYVPYVSLYAGASVRFEICRLCAHMFLGVLISQKIKEGVISSTRVLPNE